MFAAAALLRRVLGESGLGGGDEIRKITPTAATAPFDFDAVVYGAGPVGAAVALGLQQRGHRVVVCEKRTEYQVVGDAGKSINLSLSTRGNALMKQLGVYDDLLSTLVPMVSRIFADGSLEHYREPLQSINRNLLTRLLIEAAEKAGVHFEYGTGYAQGDVDAASGTVKLGDRSGKPRVIVGCDGVHGKICKLINPAEPSRSSRASEWGYYELSLPPQATAAMSAEIFNNFHIWSGKGKWSAEFIVGLPNHDGSITLTLFALMDDVKGRYNSEDGGAEKFRAYLAEAYGGDLDAQVSGVEEAIKGGFSPIWLNDHEQLAGELGDTGTFVFLCGDAALGMEQFLGLAVNLGFEGAHRGLLEHFDREGADSQDPAFWRGLVKARNVLNAGAKALQGASSKNAASMRDGCDDPLGKAVRALLENTHGHADIEQSAFESTHDWWSFCTVPLKVAEAVVQAQDDLVLQLKTAVKEARGSDDVAGDAALSEEEKKAVEQLAAPSIGPLVELRERLTREHHATMAACFE